MILETIWYKLIGVFYHLKLKHKLLLSYSILILIPLGVMSFSSYNRSSRIIQEQITQSAEQVLEQTKAFLEYKLDNIARVSNLLFASPDLHNILDKDLSTYSITQQIADTKYLENYFHTLENNNNILRIRLFVREELLYSGENINFFKLSSIQNSDRYNEIIQANGKIAWSQVYPYTYVGKSEARILSASRLIRNIQDFSQAPSVLSIDIPETDLLEIINKAQLTDNGVVYLVNANGEIICMSEGANINPKLKSKEILSDLSKSQFTSKRTTLNGVDVIVGCKRISVNDWKLITVVPLYEILAPSTNLWKYILLSALMIGLIAYGIAFYLTNSNTKRIYKMVATMRQMQKGDLDARIVVDSGDEIGVLQQDFNFMVEKVKQLMQERFEIGLAARNAELKALQAQINPHFLYNTLDLIYWMAMKNTPEDICSTVTALARFYKICLSKGKEIIPIKDEIEHVSLYIKIQNMRFENRITFVPDIDEEIYRYSTLKLILQPLVENSILHGILQKEKQSGYIKIRGRLDVNVIEIKVEDDGVGMSPEKTALLLSTVEFSASNGYGVWNINERIRMRYGSEYGLSYRSNTGKGTVVTLRFPAEELC